MDPRSVLSGVVQQRNQERAALVRAAALGELKKSVTTVLKRLEEGPEKSEEWCLELLQDLFDSFKSSPAITLAASADSRLQEHIDGLPAIDDKPRSADSLRTALSELLRYVDSRL